MTWNVHNARSWSQEEISILTRMWNDGASAREIAKALGTGRSRNSVIGMAHRSGLPPRTKSRRQPATRGVKKYKPRQRKEWTPKPRPLPPEPEPMPEMLMVSLLDIKDGQCRYPIGDPLQSGFGFCGLAVAGEHTSYCRFHHRICHESEAALRPMSAWTWGRAA